MSRGSLTLPRRAASAFTVGAVRPSLQSSRGRRNCRRNTTSSGSMSMRCLRNLCISLSLVGETTATGVNPFAAASSFYVNPTLIYNIGSLLDSSSFKVDGYSPAHARLNVLKQVPSAFWCAEPALIARRCLNHCQPFTACRLSIPCVSVLFLSYTFRFV
eukprot:6192795-Pleurochrysis_carterae.AAC.1